MPRSCGSKCVISSPRFLPRLFGACLILGEWDHHSVFFSHHSSKTQADFRTPPMFHGKIHGSQAIDRAGSISPALQVENLLPEERIPGIFLLASQALQNGWLGWSPWEMILFFLEKNQGIKILIWVLGDNVIVTILNGWFQILMSKIAGLLALSFEPYFGMSYVPVNRQVGEKRLTFLCPFWCGNILHS